MINRFRVLVSLLASLTVAGFSSSVFAQPPIVITYGPGGLAIPTMSGVAMIVLAIFLALVAMKVLRGQQHARVNLAVVAIAASAIVAGTGGIDLVARSWAIAATDMTVDGGGEITLPGPGFYIIRNLTGNTQNILDISIPPGCSVDGVFNGGARGNGGGPGNYQGQCSDSPSTSLAPTDYCDISVSCGEET